MLHDLNLKVFSILATTPIVTFLWQSSVSLPDIPIWAKDLGAVTVLIVLTTILYRFLNTSQKDVREMQAKLDQRDEEAIIRLEKRVEELVANNRVLSDSWTAFARLPDLLEKQNTLIQANREIHIENQKYLTGLISGISDCQKWRGEWMRSLVQIKK
jgi:hypothetical protein